jgi:hypothetical protein
LVPETIVKILELVENNFLYNTTTLQKTLELTNSHAKHKWKEAGVVRGAYVLLGVKRMKENLLGCWTQSPNLAVRTNAR